MVTLQLGLVACFRCRASPGAAAHEPQPCTPPRASHAASAHPQSSRLSAVLCAAVSFLRIPPSVNFYPR
jgi:hypothetical protein